MGLKENIRIRKLRQSNSNPEKKIRISTKIIVISVFLGIIPWIKGCSPLHDAAREGNIEKLQTLIEKGTKVNAKDTDDLAPLHRAAWKGDKQCVELLLAKGAAVDIRGGKNYGIAGMLAPLPAYIIASSTNETPLHIAAEQGHLEVVKVLIDHGANINAKNYHGETPLLLAFRHLNHPRSEFITPSFPFPDTHWSMEHHSEKTICLLLEKGADVNIGTTDWGGGTALHLAVGRGNKRLTKLILDRGANVNAPDKLGYTPLHHAVTLGKADKELVKLLLDRGADVNAEAMGSWKETPLKCAKDEEIKELLRQYGAKK